MPSDYFKINTSARIESMPMLVPVRGRWRASIDYYFENWSNLYGFMDNNSKLSTQAILTLERHKFTLGNALSSNDGNFTIDPSSFKTVKRGSLLDWLDYPIGYFGEAVSSNTIRTTNHPIEPILTYIDIYRNYYVNNQEGVGYVLSGNTATDSNQAFVNQSFELSYLDRCIAAYRSYSVSGSAYSLPNINPQAPQANDFKDYIPLLLISWSQRFESCGLFLRTYPMDFYRGMLSTNVGSVKSQIVATPDSQGNVTINFEQIVEANKNYDLINKLDLSGGRWRDNIIIRWATTPREQVDRPVYLGSHRAWIDSTDVVATANGTAINAEVKQPDSVLGQQSGFGFGFIDARNQKPIRLTCSDYGTLMAIFSLVPDVAYSQGLPLKNLKTRFADLYDPSFKQLGYGSISKVELSALPRYSFNDDGTVLTLGDLNDYGISVGKRIAWSEYMVEVSRSHGRMAAGEDMEQWVLNRKYRRDVLGGLFANSPLEPSTYINPSDWNNGFVSTDYKAENWRLTIYFDIYAKRPLSKRVTPKL